MWTSYPVLLVSLLSLTGADQLIDLYKNWYQGDGTYYGKDGHLLGQCTLNPTPFAGSKENGKIKHYVAMNNDHFFGSFSCGMCFRAKASGKGAGLDPIRGDFYVYVKDRCPECVRGDLDLAEDGDGRWEIEYQAVQCPVGSATFEYKFQGSNEWYLKIQTRNERVPIVSAKMYQKTFNVWTPLKRTADGFWVLDESHNWAKPLRAPYEVEWTSVNGQVVRDVIPRQQNDVVIPGGGKQFTLDPSLPTA